MLNAEKGKAQYERNVLPPFFYYTRKRLMKTMILLGLSCKTQKLYLNQLK